MSIVAERGGGGAAIPIINLDVRWGVNFTPGRELYTAISLSYVYWTVHQCDS